MADTLGTGGLFFDPVWRQRVLLTPLERDLLGTWWVRRLAYVVHAGAAAISSTQSYSRLEHSLGLLALIAHFHPDDQLVRAAALVHDIGHLPLSHTFEGTADLDHHQLGAERMNELRATFTAHGMDTDEVVSVVERQQASALHSESGVLRLDHLESWVRSGHAHGRTRESPAETLSKLTLRGGAISTDAVTAEYVIALGIDEAKSQTSTANVVATGVVRHLAGILLHDADRTERLRIAALTDHEFWAVLLNDPRTRLTAETLRRDPASWRLIPPSEPHHATDIEFILTRLYLDMPLVDGRRIPPGRNRLTELPAPGRHYGIRHAASTA